MPFPIDFDALFGTLVCWDDYVAAGKSIAGAKELARHRKLGKGALTSSNSHPNKKVL